MLTTHAAWILCFAFAMSFVYELYRATIKAGTSRYDSMRAFLQGVLYYVVAAAVIAALLARLPGAERAGLVLSIVAILVSVFHYNPKIMRERRPGILDWIEDLVFTGLLFVAAALLFYDVLGWSLHSPA